MGGRKTGQASEVTTITTQKGDVNISPEQRAKNYQWFFEHPYNNDTDMPQIGMHNNEFAALLKDREASFYTVDENGIIVPQNIAMLGAWAEYHSYEN